MLIILPSLVSGLGVACILVAVFAAHDLLADMFLAVGIVLLWLDAFITLAIVRRALRSIDRRLARLEGRPPGAPSDG